MTECITFSQLQWKYDAPDAFYPFDTPLAPAIVRGEAPGAERVVTLNLADNKVWQASALNINSGMSIARSKVDLLVRFFLHSTYRGGSYDSVGRGTRTRSHHLLLLFSSFPIFI